MFAPCRANQVSTFFRILKFTIVFLLQLTVQTQLVRIMDFVLTGLAFARKAGKAKVAVSLMKKPVNACPIALEMVILIWKLSNANVMKVGLAKIVLQNFAILIVVPMDGKQRTS